MRVSSIASVKPPGILVKARRQKPDDRGHERQRGHEQHQLHGQHQCEDPVGEQLGGFRAAGLADARIGRDKGGIEGALGKDGPEMVGQPQRHEKRIGHRPRAQDGRQHDVAQKAGDTRQQRKTTNGKNALDHRRSSCYRSVQFARRRRQSGHRRWFLE